LTGVNDTGDKLFTGVNDTTAKLTPAAEVGHGRRYCHWNSHEKAQRPLTRPETPEAAKTTANHNGII
jgi:hypothetical protein